MLIMNTKSKNWTRVVGWLVSILVAVIGTFGLTSYSANQNQHQTQAQEQSIYINIGGEQIEINEDNAQGLYGDLAENNEALSDEVDSLKETNKALSEENERFKAYGTAALVSKIKDFDSDKVSLLAYDPVNSNNWNKNEGSLNDSLGNNYSVTLPYVILGAGSFAEYYTNGGYAKLQFRIASHESMAQNNVSVIKIYADDILVFTSTEFGRKTESELFAADITGAKFVKIVCERTSGSSYDNSCILFLDSTLEK